MITKLAQKGRDGVKGKQQGARNQMLPQKAGKTYGVFHFRIVAFLLRVAGLGLVLGLGPHSSMRIADLRSRRVCGIGLVEYACSSIERLKHSAYPLRKSLDRCKEKI